MQPGREREIGLIFLRAKQTRTQSGGAKQHAGTAIDSALSNGREKEEEGETCCRREGGERRLWATIFSTSFQQSPEQDSRSLSISLLAVASRLYIRGG